MRPFIISGIAEVHSELELKLRKINIPPNRYNNIAQHPEFLNVFDVLKKRFGYNSVDMENLNGAGGPVGQVDRILELSNIQNSCEILEALAISGYKLHTEWKELYHVPCVLEGDVRVVKGIIDLGLDNYLRTLKRIKECSGKRNINYNCNLNILTLTNLEEKYWTGVEALCKCDYINFSGNKLFEDISLIKKIANSDTKKFLDVFNALKKRFGYNSVDMENLNGAGGPIGQVNRILELSDIENSCDVLEALAKSGYKLNTEWRGLSHVPSLQKEGMDAIKKLAKGNLHKKEYSQLITKLEKKLGYKNIKKDYVQLLNIAEFFSKFRSSICEKTIDILAEKDYQSIKRRVTKEDVAEMEKLAYNLWNKELDNLKLENICLYKENAQGFIELFSNLKEQEQKIVLKAIINCNYENKEIADWLDKNYLSLIREVGLSP